MCVYVYVCACQRKKERKRERKSEWVSEFKTNLTNAGDCSRKNANKQRPISRRRVDETHLHKRHRRQVEATHWHTLTHGTGAHAHQHTQPINKWIKKKKSKKKCKRERERERERRMDKKRETEREREEREGEEVVVNTVGAKVLIAMNTSTPWAPQLKAATSR